MEWWTQQTLESIGASGEAMDAAVGVSEGADERLKSADGSSSYEDSFRTWGAVVMKPTTPLSLEMAPTNGARVTTPIDTQDQRQKPR
jgi:hypothetical protein